MPLACLFRKASMNLLLEVETPNSFVTLKQMCCLKQLHTNSQQKIDISNYKLNYEKVGTGAHNILCLPGALGSIDTDFRPQMNYLDHNKFTIVAWDPPGYGKSRPPDRDFSNGAKYLWQDASLAHALMQELNLDKFSILGWSEGGRTGLILASLYPQSVNRLVVWGGSPCVNKKDIDNYLRVRNIDSWSSKMSTPMKNVYGEDYFRQTWMSWVDHYVQLHAQGGDICKGQLSKIKCPTLIIHGLKDEMVAFDHSEYLHKHIADSELYVFEEGKHNLHLRFYQQFNDLADHFLTRTQ